MGKILMRGQDKSFFKCIYVYIKINESHLWMWHSISHLSDILFSSLFSSLLFLFVSFMCIFYPFYHPFAWVILTHTKKLEVNRGNFLRVVYNIWWKMMKEKQQWWKESRRSGWERWRGGKCLFNGMLFMFVLHFMLYVNFKHWIMQILIL